MANEATIRSGLQIRKGNLQYDARPTSFQATVTGDGGPTPGSILASVAGTDVDLSELDTPGLCRIMNLDDTNYISYGIWDGVSFYPLGEVLPGESYVVRLSRTLGEEYGTGTGTSGPGINRLRVKADTAACQVLIEAFDR